MQTTMYTRLTMVLGNILKVMGIAFILASNASGQKMSPCTNFTVNFSSPVPVAPTEVRHEGVRVGSVLDQGEVTRQNLDICIDTRHAGAIEKETVFYISEGVLVVYNVWSTGKDLPARSSLPGFHNKWYLFLHEIRLLLATISNWFA